MTCKYKKEILTAEYVRSILDYDPKTGVFVWKHRNDVGHSWNGRWPGKIASTFDHRKALIIRIHQRHFRAHRLAWLWMTGAWPQYEIDHRDLNPANNKWDNLRQATHSQNNHNRKVRSDNSTGFKGVSLHKFSGLYLSRITVRGKINNLGYFKTPEEAHHAYCKAAKRLYGDFARVA